LLAKRGVVADALHGDLNQTSRERILDRFRAEQLDVIIATDVAARGIDIDHITHVINLDFPQDAEMYVHRIGRTGRAGRKGLAISFVTPGERQALASLERQLKVRVTQVPVPSDAKIALGQRDRLKESLVGALSLESTAHARKWLTELLDAEEFSAEDIAVAAITQLALQDNIRLDHVERDMPPMWARHVEGRTRLPSGRGRPSSHPSAATSDNNTSNDNGNDFRDVNEVELHVPLGRNAGMRPADVVGALANELGISGKRVGRVTILASRTFVGVPKEVAEFALSKGAKIVVRGKSVELTLSTQRAESPKGPRPKLAHGPKISVAFKRDGAAKFQGTKRTGRRSSR
jgi:ATP-dependent RNA helicase DeaD